MKTKTLRLLTVGMAFLFLAGILSALCITGAKADSASITLDPSSAVIGETIGFTISAPEGKTYDVDYTLSYGTEPTSPAQVTGSGSGSFVAECSGKITLTVELTNVDDPTDTLRAEKSVNVEKPVMSLSRDSMTYSDTDNLVTVAISNEPKVKGTVSSEPATGLEISENTVTVKSAGNYTIKYEYKDGGETKTLTKALTVKAKDPNITADSYTIRIREEDKKTISLTKDTPQDWNEPKSSNAAIATAVMSGNNVIISGEGVGHAVITVSVNAEDGKYKADSEEIDVYVVSESAPLISTKPTSVQLNKSNPTQTVTVTLNNPVVDSSGYAKVVAKMTGPTNAYNGVYIDGYRKKAGNTYAVAVSGTSTSFDIVLKARRSAVYYLQISNGGETISVPVTVTGYSTLPQTGPDYTLVYVFAGLLVLAGAGLAIVSVLKKKNNGVN